MNVLCTYTLTNNNRASAFSSSVLFFKESSLGWWHERLLLAARVFKVLTFACGALWGVAVEDFSVLGGGF